MCTVFPLELYIAAVINAAIGIGIFFVVGLSAAAIYEDSKGNLNTWKRSIRPSRKEVGKMFKHLKPLGIAIPGVNSGWLDIETFKDMVLNIQELAVDLLILLPAGAIK